MKVYICDDHASFYPVGAASVVIAETEAQARLLLNAALAEHGLTPEWKHGKEDSGPYTLVEFPADRPQARIIVDGDY